MAYSQKQFLLVEPIAKTPYPPLGLMKISNMLRTKYKECVIFDTVGNQIPKGLIRPYSIHITSLFTWDLDKLIKSIHFYADKFPRSKIFVGGIAASLLPDLITSATGIIPHKGLLEEAESFSPDYSLSFSRRINASLTYTSRGCPRRCRFCTVSKLEPEFSVKNNWEKDISPKLPHIIFWDNNWLASPNWKIDCEKIKKLNKTIDFNQGLDARLYNEEVAKELASIKIDPIRFAFDNISIENKVVRAIKLAKKFSKKEIRIYTLYNFQETPEDLYYRINLINKMGEYAFPMEYRRPNASKIKFPGPHWNVSLLRGLKLSLIFYYRKGMITDSRKSFHSIYGKTPKQFINKLYDIYEYDKKLKRKSTSLH